MTTNKSQTEQLKAWSGEFGNSYTERNSPDESVLQARARMWARILQPLENRQPESILEVGANIGLNLRALRRLSPATLTAVEPNAFARKRLADDGIVSPSHIHEAAAFDLPFDDASFDMAFTSGVLIHIAPDDHQKACAEMFRVSRRYIMCCEYFSDKLEEISYRGHDGLLFKRDFGGMWMDFYPSLTLLDYGFFWKRTTGLDNLTWWLFEKGPWV